MLKKFAFVLSVLTILTAAPAFGQSQSGCRNEKFVGTYTSATPNVDIFGDGSVIHTLTFQLILHSNGTVFQYWTGLPDYMINTGSGSPGVGSWTCRSDGMLVVSYLTAAFAPSAITVNAPNPDITLVRHVRTTLLLSVEDQNTLLTLQARSRRYSVSQDPTDPAGGTLLALSPSGRVYKRFIASDSDLLAP